MPDSPKTLLKIRELNKSFGNLHVLKDVALEVFPGKSYPLLVLVVPEKVHSYVV